MIKFDAGICWIDRCIPDAHGKIQSLLRTNSPLVIMIKLIDRWKYVNVFLAEQGVYLQVQVANQDGEQDETAERARKSRQTCRSTLPVQFQGVRLAELI